MSHWYSRYVSAERAISSLTENIEVLLRYLKTEPNGDTPVFREKARQHVEKTDELRTIKLESKL